MARNNDDASGTVWVHDPPDRDEPTDEPPGPGAPAPLPSPGPQAVAGGPPPPLPYVAQEPESTGMRFGCLVVLFAGAGVALGVAILMVFLLGGGVVYTMQAP